MTCTHGKRVKGCENCEAEIAEMKASSGNSDLLNSASELAQKFRDKAKNSDRSNDCLTIANQLERAVRMADVLGI